MNDLKIAENLVKLRHKMGITQEVIADFLGVTKASVSKWEKGLSLPDIVQIPRIASFYDITIDELMGYEAQIDAEEIRRYYNQFAEDFATKPFEEVMKDVWDFAKRYYACYPALLKVILLLMNHYDLAQPQEQPAILEKMVDLCQHVQDKSSDVNVCKEAVIYHGMIEMLRGNACATIEKLQPYQDLQRQNNGTELILLQAYQINGQMEEATEWNQVVMFSHLLSLVESGTFYLMSNLADEKIGLETIHRLDRVTEAYDLTRLHPNSYLQFLYAKALFFVTHGKEQEALTMLTDFVNGAVDFIVNAAYLHGDAYFDKVDNFFQKLDNYDMLPRNPKTVLASIGQNLQHPAFACLHDKPEFKALVNRKELKLNNN